MKVILFMILILYYAFIWILCRACTLADERENFDETN